MFRKALFAIVLLALFLLIDTPTRSEDDGGGFWQLRPSDIYFDYLLCDPTVCFGITITQSAIDKTPKWEPADEHPPLSARRAIQLADRLRSQLVKDDKGWRWCLKSATLTPWTPESPSGHWFWEIAYHACPPGGYAGPSNDLHLAVLMDGTVVRPKTSKRRSDANAPQQHPSDAKNSSKGK